MDATIKVTAGSVRIFNLNPTAETQEAGGIGSRLPAHMDFEAPAEQPVTGDWAVGQVPIEDNGVFVVVAAEAGSLRVFDEYVDEHGNVAPSNDSTTVNVAAGEEQEFRTTNSNAYKVSTGA